MGNVFLGSFLSCVATLVGSYSFIKYSEMLISMASSSMSYLNDVFIMPLFVLMASLIYFSRGHLFQFFENDSINGSFLVTVLIMIYLLLYQFNLYYGNYIEKVLGIDIYLQ